MTAPDREDFDDILFLDYPKITPYTDDELFAMMDDNSEIKPDIEENTNNCPECKSTDILEDFTQGINICTNCGQIVSNIIDDGINILERNLLNEYEQNKTGNYSFDRELLKKLYSRNI